MLQRQRPESQNAKWKTENNRRETATSLRRIETRKETVNSERLMERTNTKRLILNILEHAIEYCNDGKLPTKPNQRQEKSWIVTMQMISGWLIVHVL